MDLDISLLTVETRPAANSWELLKVQSADQLS